MGKLMNLQLFGDAEDTAVDILKEIDEEYEHMDAVTQVEVAKLAQLKRIADVLEGINGALISMGGDIEALGECVGYAPPRQGYVKTEGYKFLRIAGSVDTGN